MTKYAISSFLLVLVSAPALPRYYTIRETMKAILPFTITQD